MTENHQETQTTSRRELALGAGLVGLAVAAGRSNAQSPASVSDIAILNYALTLEHLEANFYVTGLERLKLADFQGATFARVLGPGTAGGVLTNLGRIRDHEVAHVAALRATIRSLGGVPVEPCSYSFTYKNVDEFLQIAQALEETGVSAYDGAIAMITAAAVKTAGASIATVEARHAAYLQLVNSNVPFPQAFDTAKTMREVLAIASQFITSCGTQPVGMATTAILLPKNLQTVNPRGTLVASQSLSAHGQPLKYELRVISGSASVSQGSTGMPSVQFTSPGDYIFELVVTDSAGVVSTDRTTIKYAGR
ncbi:MAG: ferritin-like domain-containing protein [Bryobacteraceae bacterium]